jgi:hypothetical protein
VCRVSGITAKTSTSRCADHTAHTCTLGSTRQTFTASTGRTTASGDLRRSQRRVIFEDRHWMALSQPHSLSQPHCLSLLPVADAITSFCLPPTEFGESLR